MQTATQPVGQALELVEGATRAVAAPQAHVPAVITPMDLLQMAMNQGADLDRLERLMNMKREYEADEARKAYFSALADFKAEAIEIIKHKRVKFKTEKGVTEYKHAELSDVVEAVGPALSRCGFSWSWSIQQAQDWITVTCTLKHRLGHTESVSMGGPPDKSGGKNAIQAVISTTTYLERHTLKAITGVSEKGDDNDGRGASDQGDVASPEEQKAANDLLAQGQEVATKGEAATKKWWGGLTPAQREGLMPEFPGLLKAARQFDKDGGAK